MAIGNKVPMMDMKGTIQPIREPPNHAATMIAPLYPRARANKTKPQKKAALPRKAAAKVSESSPCSFLRSVVKYNGPKWTVKAAIPTLIKSPNESSAIILYLPFWIKTCPSGSICPSLT